MTAYEYTKTPVAVDRLTQEITGSAVTVVLDHITLISTSLTLVFRAELPTADQAIVDGIVAAHSGVPLPPVMLTQPVDVITEPIIVDAPFRTKMHATAELLVVEPDSEGTVDWKLPEALYIQGGSITSKGIEVGDYIQAMVMDLDGIIPEPYRALKCEAWPLVAMYVVKEWMSDMNVREVDTTPLSTKIPAGLYLRTRLVTCAEGGTRKMGVNYFFVKKLA